jgi:hypothetical protein
MSPWTHSKSPFRVWDKGFSQPGGMSSLVRLRGAGHQLTRPLLWDGFTSCMEPGLRVLAFM